MKVAFRSLVVFALCTSGAVAQSRAEANVEHMLALVDTCKTLTQRGAGAPPPDLGGVGLYTTDATYDVLVELVSNAFRSRFGTEPVEGRITPADYGARVASSMTNSYQPENPHLWSGHAFSGDDVALAHVFSKPLPEDDEENTERGHCEVYLEGWLRRESAEALTKTVVSDARNCASRVYESWSTFECEDYGHPLDTAFLVEVYDSVTDAAGTAYPSTIKLKLNHEMVVLQ